MPAHTRRGRRSAIIAFATAASLAAAGLAAAPAALAAGGTWSSSFETSDPNIDGANLGATPATFTGTNTGVLAISAEPSSQANPGGESVEMIADGNSATKWFAGVSPSTGSPLAAIYDYGTARTFSTYTVTSANDESGRDPKDWTVAGSNDGSTWTTLETVTGQSFDTRFKSQTYNLTTTGSYRYYRLRITANNGASGTQLADWTPQISTGTPAPGPISLVTSSGPTGGWSQKQGAGFTGKRSAYYWGKHLAAGAVKTTVAVNSGLNIAVDTNTEFSYKVYPVLNADWEYSATYVALDLKFSDGTWLSANNSVRDQNGFRMTARDQGAEKALFANQWNSVKVPLGSYAGKTITQIALTYDNPAGVADTVIRGYVDDVSIKDVAPINGAKLVNYVETRRGTQSNGAFSRGTNIPATTVPNGFNFWTPFTNADSNTLYEYHRANNSENLPSLQGVGISHETSIWMGDSNQLVFMPSTSASATDAAFGTRAVPFSHDDEIGRPDYYSVEFRDPANQGIKSGLKIEMAPSSHAGVVRFTYPASQTTGTVFIDGGVSNSVGLTVTGNKLEGYVQGTKRGGSGAGSTRMYVYGEFDRTSTAQGAATNGNGARYARFDTSTNKTVTLRVATSFISAAQAQKNLQLEIDGASLETVRDAAASLWQDRLSVIDLSQSTLANDTDRVNVYSNLYRLNMYPNARWENTGTAGSPVYKYASAVGGTSAENTDQNVPVKSGKNYVNNGFWDTYRTAWPLYTFLYPEFAAELEEGFLKQYDDGGWVSRWTSPGYSNIMTGTSSDVSFADVYISSGLPGATTVKDSSTTVLAQAERAFEAAAKNATVVSPSESTGRKGLFQSIFLGYTTDPTHETVSWGLEGFINDDGIAKMAEKLSQETSLSAAKRARYAEQAEYYADRAKNYVNMFNSSVNFFTTRNADGTFSPNPSNFNPKTWWGPYTETNGWNFAFHAPFDPDGLAGLYGETTAGIKAKLDEFYATPEKSSGTIHEELEASAVRLGQLGMSNQVSHHIPYISAATGDPTRTQEVVRESLQRLFVGADIGQGYLGDEDNGEMSSWYLFSALGFYPLALASGEYTVGSPLFDKVVVHRAASQGGDLTINAANNSRDNVYVSGVTVGSKTLTQPKIELSDLRAANTLNFTMSGAPSNWGKDLNRQVKAPSPLADLTKASYSSSVGTGVTNAGNLSDDTSDTSATITSGSTVTTTSTVGPVEVKTYTITSAAKAAAPSSWKLEGRTGGGAWTTLDERTGQVFAFDKQTQPYQVATRGSYGEYRLTFNNGTSVAEVELLVDPQGSGSSELAVNGSANLQASSSGAFNGTVAVLSGDVAGATATVDFGDGSAPVTGTVAVGGLGGATVSAAHTYANSGTYPVKITVTKGSETKTGETTITFARDLRFASNFDTACLTVAGVPANCDGNGYAYDKTSLATAHETYPALIQGTEHTVPGNTSLKFTLPIIANGQKDNLTGKGVRKVRVNLGANATKVSFIGSANESDLSKQVTLTYADGATQNIGISYNNWDAATGFGNIPVGSSIGRINGSGSLVDSSLRPKIWATPPTDLQTGHGEVVWLEIPAAGSGKAQIHLFAVATDGNQAATAPIAVTGGSTLSVTEGSTVPVQLATTSGGESFAGKSAVINWGDGSPATTVTVAGDGTISSPLPYTEAGNYTITITVDDGVTSKNVTRQISVAARAVTSTTLTSDVATLVEGGSVALSAQVSAGGTGSVEFFSSDASIGSAQVTDGVATKSVSGLVPGVYTFTARYLGDAGHAPSVSGEVTVTVAQKQVPPVVASVSAPRFSKTSQAYGSVTAKRARVSVVVSGATAGTVTFKAGAKSLGTAPLAKSGSAYVATLTLPAALAVGSYAGVTATLVAGGETTVSAKSVQVFKVVKATTSKVTLKGKKFKKGSKPKVSVKVAKLSSGQWASGTVRVLVGKKVVGKAKLSVKAKGKVKITLKKRYAKAIKVKAKFVPQSTKTVAGKSSKTVKVKIR
ncbi:GH92 family glycosyl hydrolase [Rarobacter faecitabidus]|nr:GH92 family glycosyl hydrolase [Rarobacter faecitabidus]